MNVVVLDEAEVELTAAAEWYERERTGLGDDLLAEADGVLSAVAERPTTWPFVSGSKVVRRYLFSRFPYIVYYVVRGEAVFVIAFGHTSRHPGYWRGRL